MEDSKLFLGDFTKTAQTRSKGQVWSSVLTKTLKMSHDRANDIEHLSSTETFIGMELRYGY